MQMTTDELLLLLGSKEAELFILRRHVARLEAAVPTAAADGTLGPAPLPEPNPS